MRFTTEYSVNDLYDLIYSVERKRSMGGNRDARQILFIVNGLQLLKWFAVT